VLPSNPLEAANFENVSSPWSPELIQQIDDQIDQHTLAVSKISYKKNTTILLI